MLARAALRHEHPTYCLRPLLGAEVDAVDELIPEALGRSDHFGDRCPVVLLSEFTVGGELFERRVHVEPRRRGLEPRGSAIARPAIVLGALDHPGSYRVEHGVAEHVPEVRLFLDQLRVEAPAEEMPPSFVPAIEPACVAAVEPLHPLREISLRSLDDEMKVIRHEHEHSHAPGESLRGPAEKDEKRLAIGVAEEDRLLLVAPRGHVIDGAGILNANRSCHSTTEDPSGSRNRRGISMEW